MPVTPRLPHVLLVTGSRSLGGCNASRDWAETIVVATIAELDPLRDTLVTGDAPGPDCWSAHCAEVLGMRWSRFQLDGTRHDWHWLRSQCTAWADTVPARGSAEWRRWPLTRNRVMVAAVARVVAAGRCTASALALEAPWSRTHGTRFTAALCEGSGIAVASHVCPAEFKPIRIGLL